MDVIFDMWVTKYPLVKSQMERCRHAYTDCDGVITPSPWHEEDSIWTHVNMVAVATKALLYNRNASPSALVEPEDYIAPIIASFTHDYGKLLTRKEKPDKNKVNFYNHGPMGTLHALEFATHVVRELGIEKEEGARIIHNVAFLTSRHMDCRNKKEYDEVMRFCNYDHSLIFDMDILNSADCMGRHTTNDRKAGDRIVFSEFVDAYSKSLREDGPEQCEADDVDFWVYCGITPNEMAMLYYHLINFAFNIFKPIARITYRICLKRKYMDWLGNIAGR
jgi:hypothetical protein